MFKVHGADLIGIVNLQTKKCSCWEFTLDEYLCVHAFAVCKEHKIFPYSLFKPFYQEDIWRVAYSNSIYPLANKKLWHASVEILDRVVLPRKFDKKAEKQGPTVSYLKARVLIQKNVNNVIILAIIDKYVPFWLC